MWVGVLADTQGELHPEVSHIFQGMDFIIHCGGIGSPTILEELSNLSPISGVIGSEDGTDEYPFGPVLYRELGGVLLLVTHCIGTPSRPLKVVIGLLAEKDPKVLLFGQTGEAFNASIDNRLWFNPGRAARRGSGDKSVGILEIEGSSVRGEIISLDG